MCVYYRGKQREAKLLELISFYFYFSSFNTMSQSIADLTTEIRPTSGDIPPPLVGASTTVVGNQLFLFGGRLVSSRQLTNHLYILNLDTFVWHHHIAQPNSPPPPRPRYFHSTDFYKRYLIVFGGMANSSRSSLSALDDMCLFDVKLMVWKHVELRPSLYKPQARYAHLSVRSADKLVIMGGQNMSNQYINEINVFCLSSLTWIAGASLQRQYGAYRSVAFCPTDTDTSFMPSAPFWEKNDNSSHEDDTSRICVYSNYNFIDVTRELQSFSSMPSLDFRDHSGDMSGVSLPPGLRFPSGHLLGHHMILTGIYLTPTVKAFHIWALNLANLVWSRIDAGSMFAQGSWNKSILYEERQQLVVFGDRSRDLLHDYNNRQVNYNQVAIVELEAFGIYTFPQEVSAPMAQELGLSLLDEPSMADMEIITEDKVSIPVNSSIIRLRWPYFATLLKKKDQKTFKRLVFPETHRVTLAFLQFLYTDHLITAQQHHPQVLSRLLLLSDMYCLPRLGDLVTHALHQVLTISTSSLVYEISALTGRIALQVRALRVMINTKKIIQQQQQQQASNPLVTNTPLALSINRPTVPSQPFSPVSQRTSTDSERFPTGIQSPTSPTMPRWAAVSKPPSNDSIFTPALKSSRSSAVHQRIPPGVLERTRKASVPPFPLPHLHTGLISPTYEGSNKAFRF